MASPKADTPSRALPRRRKSSTTVVIVVVAILVALLLGLGAYLVPKYLAPKLNGDPTVPGVAWSPSEAVQEYLTALSQGDAVTALKYSQTKATEPAPYLTNSFLATLMSNNPLTDIQVPAGQATTTPATIEASYTLGGQVVQAHFTVQQYDKQWRLDGGFLTLNLTALLAKGVPLELNGIPLGDAAKIQLFPGVYTLASDNQMLTLENASFTVEYPESNPTFSSFRFALSPDGIAKIQGAAQAKLDWCLKQQELQPAGCGFGFAGAAAGVVDNATITWTLSPDSANIAAIEPKLDTNTLNLATATTSITVALEAVSTDKRHLYNDTSGFTMVQADFSDPMNIVVIFG